MLSGAKLSKMTRGNMTYKAQTFIDAIEGTGGNISHIAQNVGCTWHTAKKWIDEYPTVKLAYDAERFRINDQAKRNIIDAIIDGSVKDSWRWLSVRDPDFMPKERKELTGKDGEAIEIDDITLTDEQRAERLAAILDRARARRDR